MQQEAANDNPAFSIRTALRVFLMLTGFFILISSSGCGGDDPPPELPFLEVEDDVLMQMYKVEYLFSDSAILRAKMTAGRVTERIPKENQASFHELAGGVKIELFDYYGRTNGVITSDSAIFYANMDVATLYNNVKLVNKKRETMETDSIVWAQKKDSIFTGAPVHIMTSAQEIFARDGLKAKADFSSYVLYGTSGEVEIDEE